MKAYCWISLDLKIKLIKKMNLSNLISSDYNLDIFCFEIYYDANIINNFIYSKNNILAFLEFITNFVYYQILHVYKFVTFVIST